jgi:hypothetical protein
MFKPGLWGPRGIFSLVENIPSLVLLFERLFVGLCSEEPELEAVSGMDTSPKRRIRRQVADSLSPPEKTERKLRIYGKSIRHPHPNWTPRPTRIPSGAMEDEEEETVRLATLTLTPPPVAPATHTSPGHSLHCQRDT